MQWVRDNEIAEVYNRYSYRVLEDIAELLISKHSEPSLCDELRQRIWAKFSRGSTVASKKCRTKDYIYRQTFEANRNYLTRIWQNTCDKSGRADISEEEFEHYQTASKKWFEWVSQQLARNNQIFENEALRKMMELDI